MFLNLPISLLLRWDSLRPPYFTAVNGLYLFFILLSPTMRFAFEMSIWLMSELQLVCNFLEVLPEYRMFEEIRFCYAMNGLGFLLMNSPRIVFYNFRALLFFSRVLDWLLELCDYLSNWYVWNACVLRWWTDVCGLCFILSCPKLDYALSMIF